ncbi:MAG TPA: serine/threonine-protein kinase [Pseudonocardia sp.]|nr:serine/threonine-protein kinase [Pseudonocardia sp.]
MALKPGDQIAERYHLNRRIAIGGMGEVWEAADERLGRTVAIKVLKPEIGSDPEFLERFRTEARIAASINHRGIAGVHDYGEDVTPDGTPTAYIVMELVRGEPLSTRLATRGKLGTVLTLDLLEQAGRALQAAHSRGFVHRDVKPGNILLSEDGTVKLTDFGIAKAAAAAPITASGMVMGTAHYIAPEQARGAEAGSSSDVYSLGVVGYECLAGHRPFQDESPVKVAMMHINDPVPPLPSDIPTNVRALIAIALVKDPKRRYSDGAEFAAAVAAVRRGQPPPTPGTPPLLGTGPRPIMMSQPVDRVAGPSSDGLALTGLAAPGLPPLPGNQTSGRLRPLTPAPVRGGRGGLTVAFVLLTAAAVAIGVLVVRQAVRSDGVTERPAPGATAPTAPPAANTATSVPEGSVLVESAGYSGRPVAAVQFELQSNGLRTVARTPQGQVPASPATCTVTEVSPAGTLRKGTVVTITCVQH